MDSTIDSLVFDLVAWIAKEDRSYPDVMDAWRTSCPRLPVWEEANARGYVTRVLDGDRGPMVRATPAGRALVAEKRA